MSDIITLEVSNRIDLEKLAHDKGYATVQDYLLALIAADQNKDDEAVSPAEHFRAGWREVLAGHEGVPYDEIWEGIDDDTEG